MAFERPQVKETAETKVRPDSLLSEYGINPDKLKGSDSHEPMIQERPKLPLTTHKERIKETPKDPSKGMWEGERGESKYIPYDTEASLALRERGLDGISYKDGRPDFSPVSCEDVSINMTSDRPSNFQKADIQCAEQWNAQGFEGKSDWTARDVKEWRKANEYSWHECDDMRTCQLVPTSIHRACKHIGGRSECLKYEELMGQQNG